MARLGFLDIRFEEVANLEVLRVVVLLPSGVDPKSAFITMVPICGTLATAEIAASRTLSGISIAPKVLLSDAAMYHILSGVRWNVSFAFEADSFLSIEVGMRGVEFLNSWVNVF